MKRKQNPIQKDREIIMSLCETKGKEIGLCWIENNTNTISFCQYLDTNTYIQTLILINMYNPLQIIISKTQEKSELSELLKSKKRKLTFLPRSCFNENDGITSATNLFKENNYENIKKHLKEKYLCSASLNALMKHIEKTNSFIHSSLYYGRYITLNNKLRIDIQSVQQLELINNVIDGRKTSSLFSVMNHTVTSNGRKMLIDNILQPPNDQETIEERQLCVEFFLRNSEIYYKSIDYLKHLPDLDKIIISLLQLHRTESIKDSTLLTIMKNMGELYKVLYYIPQFQRLFDKFENLPIILLTMKRMLETSEMVELQQQLEKFLNPSVLSNFLSSSGKNHFINSSDTNSTNETEKQTDYSTFSSSSNRIYFLVKQNINPYLDLSQQLLIETLEEIEQLKEENEKSNLIMKSNQNGYYFIFHGKKEHIPSHCCRVVKISDDKWNVNTPELVSLSTRCQSIKSEILKLSIQVIKEHIETIRQSLNITNILNRMIEITGLLDMLLSFVTYSSTTEIACKPTFNTQRSIIIKQGKHPICMTKVKKFIPNDTFIDDVSRFCLINGINMGGKSTYIKQIALLVIMAHMGCFIPAEAASLRPLTTILTRLSTDDNMEGNESTFMKEMKEVKEIVEIMNDKSLILIDELGRGTSIVDGVSIAFSISEEIILKSLATCLFISHFPELNILQKLYPHVVRQYHMEVSLMNNLLYPTYVLVEGFDQHDYYGIQIAEMSGIPLDIIHSALELKKKIQHHVQFDVNTSKFDLGQKLLSLKDNKLQQDQLVSYLNYLKQMYFE